MLQLLGEDFMEILINHWHCIMPLIAIFFAIFLMQNRDKVSAEKNGKNEKEQGEEK